MEDKTKKIWAELITYFLIAFSAFFIGMGQSNKDVQNDCNQFIADEILTHDVRKCLGDFSVISPDYDFINYSFLINAPVNNSGNKTKGEEI